jgi:hypothetical protein
MTIGSKQNRTPPQRIQRLWATKTIIVIDEVSMVDLQTLAKINNRCKVARSLSPDSPELFGGLPIVVFMEIFINSLRLKVYPFGDSLETRKRKRFREKRYGIASQKSSFWISRCDKPKICLSETFCSAQDKRS